MTRHDIDMTRRDIPYSAMIMTMIMTMIMIMTSQYTIYKRCFHSQNKYYNRN